MTDPLIAKILYGLIASSLLSIVIVFIANNVSMKMKAIPQGEKPNGRMLASQLVHLLIVSVWYIGLIWYWFTLLAQVEA